MLVFMMGFGAGVAFHHYLYPKVVAQWNRLFKKD